RAYALLLCRPRRRGGLRRTGHRGSHDQHLRPGGVPPTFGDLARVPGHYLRRGRRRLSPGARGAAVDHRLRRTRLAARLVELGAEGLLITRLPNVRYLTGFTGSNGQMLLTPGDAAFFTDGRYTEQARHEVPDLERLTCLDGFVAFGEEPAEPHREPTDRPLSRGDVVKMDFGALVDGYHADMTRTVAFGEPPSQLRDVPDLVRTAQEAGIEAVRVGATGAEVDAAARTVIEEAGLGEHFTHGLGHGVGLEIHEGPRLGRGSDDALPAGAVVT